MAKLKSRRRNLGEICTRRDAIRNHCMECMGYQISEIKRCTAKECWLFPFRPGATRAELNAEREEAGLKPVEKKKKTLSLLPIPTLLLRDNKTKPLSEKMAKFLFGKVKNEKKSEQTE